MVFSLSRPSLFISSALPPPVSPSHILSFCSQYEYLTFRQQIAVVVCCSAESGINAKRRKRDTHTHTYICLLGGLCAAQVDNISCRCPCFWITMSQMFHFICTEEQSNRFCCDKLQQKFLCQMLTASHLPLVCIHSAKWCFHCVWSSVLQQSVMRHSLPTEQQWTLYTPGSFRPQTRPSDLRSVFGCDLIE